VKHLKCLYAFPSAVTEYLMTADLFNDVSASVLIRIHKAQSKADLCPVYE